MKTRSVMAIYHGRKYRRYLFVGLNLLGLIAIYYVFVAPVQRLLSDSAQLVAERRQILARYEAIVAHEKQIQNYAQQVSEINAQGELFEGDSDGVINANLQARLKFIAEKAQVSIRSIQMLPNKDFQGIKLAGARIDVTGPNESIHTLVQALEGETPLLLITAATLRSQMIFMNTQHGQPPDEIEAQFDVFGGASKLSQR